MSFMLTVIRSRTNAININDDAQAMTNVAINIKELCCGHLQRMSSKNYLLHPLYAQLTAFGITLLPTPSWRHLHSFRTEY